MDYEFVPGRDDFPPDEIAMLRQQLAAALAACEAKDAVLNGIKLYRAFNGDDWPSREAITALVIKPDASALKAHEEVLIEKIAAFVETQRNDVPACGFEFANTIRELKGKP